jgi:hypothetical protein
MKTPGQWLKELRPNETPTSRMLSEIKRIQNDARKDLLEASLEPREARRGGLGKRWGLLLLVSQKKLVEK